jgi:hypothetical protein
MGQWPSTLRGGQFGPGDDGAGPPVAQDEDRVRSRASRAERGQRGQRVPRGLPGAGRRRRRVGVRGDRGIASGAGEKEPMTSLAARP